MKISELIEKLTAAQDEIGGDQSVIISYGLEVKHVKVDGGIVILSHGQEEAMWDSVGKKKDEAVAKARKPSDSVN